MPTQRRTVLQRVCQLLRARGFHFSRDQVRDQVRILRRVHDATVREIVEGIIAARRVEKAAAELN